MNVRPPPQQGYSRHLIVGPPSDCTRDTFSRLIADIWLPIDTLFAAAAICATIAGCVGYVVILKSIVTHIATVVLGNVAAGAGIVVGGDKMIPRKSNKEPCVVEVGMRFEVRCGFDPLYRTAHLCG
mmetsp:Transcript_31619/g.52190  ORF Transcript_31619/g.52190 Transcript_31619/m.52190 type:complete len:126 (+) Transcript_31619:398-775(+)